MMTSRRSAATLSHWMLSACLVLAGCTGTTVVRGPNPELQLPNFVQVDDGLYRGAQPTPAGMRELSTMGIKTVISLRNDSPATREERALAEQLGMRWVNLPMWYFWRPSRAQIATFLAIASDPASRPVFMHCRQGQNRVGQMAAIYRIARQGWSPARAYAEGRELGMVPWNLASRRMLFRDVPKIFVTDPPQP